MLDENVKYLYNTCCRCGNPIRVKAPKDIFMHEVLESSDVAVCKTCDSASGWKSYACSKRNTG